MNILLTEKYRKVLVQIYYHSELQFQMHIGNSNRIKQKYTTEVENKWNSIHWKLKRKPIDTCLVQGNLLIKGLQPTDKSISETCKNKSGHSQFRNLIMQVFLISWLVGFVFFQSRSWSSKRFGRQSQNYWNK